MTNNPSLLCFCRFRIVLTIITQKYVRKPFAIKLQLDKKYAIEKLKIIL